MKDQKWAKDVAAGDKSPKAYESGNAGKVKESKEVGATGSTMKNPIKQKFGDHGPE